MRKQFLRFFVFGFVRKYKEKNKQNKKLKIILWYFQKNESSS